MNDILRERVDLGALGSRLLRVGLVAGVAGLLATVLIGFAEGNLRRLLFSYLVSFAYWLSLTLGAMFFVLIQHVVRAGWSVAVRRLAEVFSCNVLLMALFAVPVLLGTHELYEWSHEEVVAADPILSGKSGYLNLPFFLVRFVIYFGAWALISRFFMRRSAEQDQSGDPRLTLRMERASAPSIIVFALTLSFFSFDFLMSLDPHWFSTIFGVYYFAGAVVGFFALAALALSLLQRSGPLQGILTAEHYHDLGKLIFAFIVFWAYIGFSQYMLIWYANLPEETGWLIRRQSGGWGWVALGLLFGHFLAPFLMLMSRHVKRFSFGLVLGSVWVLLMHYVDIYWLVMPEYSADSVPIDLLDLTCFVTLGGFVLAATAWRLRRHALIPVGDPRLGESLAFENV